MEKLKQFPAAQKRLVCILLALICMLGLLPSTAFAAGRIPSLWRIARITVSIMSLLPLAPVGCTR